LDVKREQIITLLNSNIRPQVAIAGPTEPADAYVCTLKAGDKYETLIFFHMVNSHKGVVYHWDEGPQPRATAKSVEKDALRFLDEMGFQMDSLHFRKRSAEEQTQLMETLPPFQLSLEPPEEEMESLEAVAVDEADELVEDMEEISIESFEEEVEEIAAEPEEVEEVAVEPEEFAEIGEAEPELEAFETPEPAVETAPEPAVAEPEVEAFEEVAVEEESVVEMEAEPADEFFDADEEVAETAVAVEDTVAEEVSEIAEGFEEVETAESVGVIDEQPSHTPEPVAEAISEPEPASEPEVFTEAPPPEPPPPPPPPSSVPEVDVQQPESAAEPAPQAVAAETKVKADLGGVDLEPLARFLASM